MSSEMENPFLPFEIITNILTRLPIKSIVKFQCVCKAWKHLFKTQSFISQHTLHSSHQNPFLLIHAYDHTHHHRSTVRLLDHNMQTDEVLNTHLIDSFKRGWTIVGSSNGFICVELAAEAGRSPTSYLVWNPVSNEVIEVPPTLHRYSPSVRFGYSSVVDDYKIVTFYFPDPDFLTLEQEQYFTFDYGVICGVEVFSLRSGSWKELEFGDLTFIVPHAAYVNGTIFWCGYVSGSSLEMLVAFDIATEVFTITSIDTFSADVDAQEYDDFPHRVYEYGNKLAMCDYYAINSDTGEYKGCYIILWVFEECAGESGKSYRCMERYKFGPFLNILQPTCFWRNEIVFKFVIRSEAEDESDQKKYIHLLNLISNQWNKFPNFLGANHQCDIFNYEKRLVSVCNT